MFVVGVILISNVSSNLSGTTLVCTPPEILVLFRNILEAQPGDLIVFSYSLTEQLLGLLLNLELVGS